MFYNDFILVFIEKYQQKYQQNILLHQDYIKFTARFYRNHYGKITLCFCQSLLYCSSTRFVDKYARVLCRKLYFVDIKK